MTILDKVKLLIGVEDKDSLLTLLIEQAESEFLQHTNQHTIPDGTDNLIIDMVVTKYNLIGTEGLSSSSYSGASESYSHYSPQLKAAMARYKKVRVL